MNLMTVTSHPSYGQGLLFPGAASVAPQSASVHIQMTPLVQYPQPSVANDFHEYVEKTKKYSSVDYEEAVALVTEGEIIINRVRAGELQNLSREEKRNCIIPLMWYLISKACEKGEGFLQGMVVFEDPGHAVGDFFAPVASRRLSSHYPYRVDGSNFGIDQKAKLPYGFRTVLFGKLKVPKNEGEWTFIKPENYGTESLPELTCHAIDYCCHKILKAFGWNFGKLDRHEHVKEKYVKHGLRMKSSGFPISHQMAKWGIAGIFPAILPYLRSPESISRLTTDQKEALSLFLCSVSSHDWIHIRSGKEVVLSERPDPYKSDVLALSSLLTA